MAINKDIIIPKRNITYEDVNEMLNDIREIGIENVEKILVIKNNPCPTNGDMIKTMFPNAQIDYHEKSDLVDRYVTVFPKHCDTCQDYSLEWWNAPYEEEE